VIDTLALFVNQCNRELLGVAHQQGVVGSLDGRVAGRLACIARRLLATIRPVYTLLSILQVILAVLVIFLVLLHSGKDAGLSGAFGIGGGGSSFGGGSMVERNLDRATIFFSILFVVNTLVLLKI
jgi:preprotein translocase subunit SecG